MTSDNLRVPLSLWTSHSNVVSHIASMWYQMWHRQCQKSTSTYNMASYIASIRCPTWHLLCQKSISMYNVASYVAFSTVVFQLFISNRPRSFMILLSYMCNIIVLDSHCAFHFCNIVVFLTTLVFGVQVNNNDAYDCNMIHICLLYDYNMTHISLVTYTWFSLSACKFT